MYKKRLREELTTARHYFLTGLLVFIPAFLTISLLWWVFDTIDSILEPLVEYILGKYYPGIGFAVTILIIFICGIIGNRVAGRNIINFTEHLISRVPVVSQLYNGIKQILESFSTKENSSFLAVVFIEFPRKGTYTPALVTNETIDESGRKILNIYVPTAPNPTSGFLQILPEDQVIRTSMSVDDALKMVISAGKFSHDDVRNLPANPQD
ncbi:MAG: DUF502 domain-containing protein [Chloroflexi bacterium]|jgi:uncharacterized membrane protein|nr:DUF502 domain-containing protein [Chloroflexota bacterium]